MSVPIAVATVATTLLVELACVAVLARAESPLIVPMAASATQFGALGVVGALVIARRPSQRIGWTMLLVATLTGLLVAASTYLAVGPGRGLLADAAFAAAWLAGGPLLALWLYFLHTFPGGGFASPRERRVFVVVSVLASGGLLALYLVAPTGVVPPSTVPIEAPATVRGPLALGADAAPLIGGLAQLGGVVPLIGLVALVRHYALGDPMLRAQIRFVVWAVVIQVVLEVIIHFIGAAAPLRFLGAVLVPAAILFAIERSHLWAIDRVVSRAVAYVVLSVGLTVVIAIASSFAGLAFGQASLVVSLVVAFAFAVVAEPLRRRIERVAAEALDPGGAQALSAFATLASASERTTSSDETVAVVREAVRSLTGAERTGVWLAVSVGGRTALRSTEHDGPSHLVLGATDLDRLREAEPLRSEHLGGPLLELLQGDSGIVVPILARGQLIGTLTVCGASRQTDDALLRAMAGQAALALREQRLTEELRARLDDLGRQAEELRDAQQRLAAAQLDERRRIERDLHDGAQQRLVGLALALARLSERAEPELAVRIREVRAMVEGILGDLRDLARGIYPDVLADHGLARALTALARDQELLVRVEVDPVLAAARLPRELEAALYFTALEAMTNATKHSGAAAIRVALRALDDRVELTVEDDGAGFDPRAPASGVGLRNMSDRMTALGGTCTVEGSLGGGTVVRAALPRRRAAQLVGRSLR